MAHANNRAHTGGGSNIAAGGDPVVVDTIDTSPENDEDGTNQLENSDWQALINAQTRADKLKQPKSDYIDYSTVGPAFKLSEASKNVHELDPSAIPNALKQMAHYWVFIPLSMFTSHSLKIIRDNIGDLYMKKKTGLSAGKYVLNSDLFLSEDSFTEQTFFQAYRNWLKLLGEVSEPEVTSGWNKHHDLMINDANFSSSFATWRSHDRQLRTSFFNAPFVLDVDSRTYIKGFDQKWMVSEISSFRKGHSDSPSDSRSFRGAIGQNRTLPHANTPAHTVSHCYNPYDKPNMDSFQDNTCRVLCLHCGDFGHRAGKCIASILSKPSCTFIADWKDGKLISVKTNKQVCVTYNVRGSCNDSSNPLHGEHICSLCTDAKHAATACTRN